MAHAIYNNAYVKVGTVDLSAHVRSLAWPMTRELRDNTSMGNTARANIPGLADSDIQVTFAQDFTAALVDATVGPAFLAGTAIAFEMRPDAGVQSANNPTYSVATCYITAYNPLAGTLGDIETATVTIKPATTTPPVRTAT